MNNRHFIFFGLLSVVLISLCYATYSIFLRNIWLNNLRNYIHENTIELKELANANHNILLEHTDSVLKNEKEIIEIKNHNMKLQQRSLENEKAIIKNQELILTNQNLLKKILEIEKNK